MPTPTYRLLALLTLLPLGRLSAAEPPCGQFWTTPGATVQYMYQPGTDEFESLPVQAHFDIACDDLALTAVLLSPIIGVDEVGNEIFPTGLEYPLTAEFAYNPSAGYQGSLQGTQYNAQWTFLDGPGETVLWNGTVSWFGGRYEATTINNIVLTPVPESSTVTMLAVALLAAAPLIWSKTMLADLRRAVALGRDQRNRME